MKLGVIGAGGVMAGTLLRAMVKAHPQLTVGVSELDPARREAIVRDTGAQAFDDAAAAVAWADFIILGVKPYQMEDLIADIRPVCSGKAFLSIALGYTTEKLKAALPGARVMRTMPSVTAMVGEGVTLISKEHTLTAEEFDFALSLLKSVGMTVVGEEDYVSKIMPITGSGPAYIFIIMEAMADAAVKIGVPRALAYETVAQMVLGAGKMARDSGKIPAELKDSVCSPSGATICAVKALEDHGVRAAMMAAVEACYNRGKELE